jgi:copper resistance protein B
MRKTILTLAGGILPALFTLTGAKAEQLIWGIQAEQFEYRISNDAEVAAWDVDGMIGTDEFKLRYTGEGEYVDDREDTLEVFESKLVGQVPISDFFDAKAGIRLDAPDGPDRWYGVLGVQGLAQQWFEVDLDLFVSEKADTSLRLDAEYEGLLTNYLTLTPSIELDLPFSDDEEVGIGAFGPKLEIGARLSYDLVDRTVSPYIGVHYERVFGKTADFKTEEGEEKDELYFVIGSRFLF